MSPEELEEIQARCGRTTPGPWTSYIEGRDHESGSSFIMTSGEDIEPCWMGDDEQDFAAQARQDLPRLLTEVRRLSGNPGAADGADDADRPLDAEALAAMERRCEFARAGPWTIVSRLPPNQWGARSVLSTGEGGRPFDLDGAKEADHEFIAHARTDLPRLIAEVRRLRTDRGLE